ncbi:hypothetical protein FSP39_009398 [Pinctada imbricata]|uniref:Speriolin C-terminal domain-containing protein n=1 Tax=Pinctada imbricata TaxID=66713 RepID=A0AA88XI81_PINIB|nr:hypothetical protein FSP39_009398 [Pinctada imbricata]
MSYGGDFPTLHPGDLEGGKSKQERSFIEIIRKENQRLQEENKLLKRCLLLTKENSDLKTANILAHVVSLLDDRQAFPWAHPSASMYNSEYSKEFSQNRQVPEMPSVTTEDHQTSSFRPIVPERPQSFKPTLVGHNLLQQQGFQDTNSKNRLHMDPTSRSQNDRNSASSVDHQNSHLINSMVVDPASRDYCYPPTASSAGQQAIAREREAGPLQNVLNQEETRESRVPVNSYVESSRQEGELPNSFRRISSTRDQNVPSPYVENESWESMMKDGYVEEQVNEDMKVDSKGPGLSSNQRHGLSEGYGTQRQDVDAITPQIQMGTPQATSTHQDVNATTPHVHIETPQATSTQRQDVNATTPQVNVGSPLATSTPLRKNISNDTKANLLNRPVDQILGIQPLVSEYHTRKVAQMHKNKRLIGEIAFQLDRRILEFVFAWKDMEQSSNMQRKRRYYGYSTANIGQMIRKEATKPNGDLDHKKELEMRYRFDYVIRTLKKFGYNLDLHGGFSQDMVNKHGLMVGPPDAQTVRKFGLDDPVVLRLLLRQMIADDRELANALILLDCLCLMAYDDKRPIFMW